MYSAGAYLSVAADTTSLYSAPFSCHALAYKCMRNSLQYEQEKRQNDKRVIRKDACMSTVLIGIGGIREEATSPSNLLLGFIPSFFSLNYLKCL